MPAELFNTYLGPTRLLRPSAPPATPRARQRRPGGSNHARCAPYSGTRQSSDQSAGNPTTSCSWARGSCSMLALHVCFSPSIGAQGTLVSRSIGVLSARVYAETQSTALAGHLQLRKNVRDHYLFLDDSLDSAVFSGRWRVRSRNFAQIVRSVKLDRPYTKTMVGFPACSHFKAEADSISP